MTTLIPTFPFLRSTPASQFTLYHPWGGAIHLGASWKSCGILSDSFTVWAFWKSSAPFIACCTTRLGCKKKPSWIKAFCLNQILLLMPTKCWNSTVEHFRYISSTTYRKSGDSVSRQQLFWKTTHPALHTSLGETHCHRMWKVVSASLLQKGHIGSEIIFLRLRLSRVGRISLQALHRKKNFHTREV